MALVFSIQLGFRKMVVLTGYETVEEALVLKADQFAEGTYIIPLLRSVHRDKNHWEMPDHLYPLHFLNEQGKFVKREAFMSFSAGRRVCIGETLARMELFLFFTSLLQNFSFHAAEGVNGEDIDLSPTGGLTLSAPNIQVRALARNINV